MGKKRNGGTTKRKIREYTNKLENTGKSAQTQGKYKQKENKQGNADKEEKQTGEKTQTRR